MSTESVDAFEKAKEYFFLGNDYFAIANFEKAEHYFTSALNLMPDRLSLLTNLTATYLKLDKLTDAEQIIHKTFKIHPSDETNFLNYGILCEKLFKHDEALEAYENSLIYSPQYAEAYGNRGHLLNKLERSHEALLSLNNAIALDNGYAEAYFNKGLVLSGLELPNDALQNYDKAIELNNNYAEAYCNKGLILHELKHQQKALQNLNQSVELTPGSAEAYSNRGLVLHDLNLIDDALKSYAYAIKLNPNYAEAYSNQGLAFHALNRLPEALQSYKKAIEIQSGYAQAHWNNSLTLLLTGDLLNGFKEYDWRRKIKNLQLTLKQNAFSEPIWLGNHSLENKTILLHCEQGLGDTLQFSRYTKLFNDLGAKVLLQIQKPLIDLFEQSNFPCQILNEENSIPEIDYHCPLLSLPMAFKTNLETIPNETPYLQCNSIKREIWSTRLGTKEKPRIGIAWSGSPSHQNDHNRSIDLKEFLGIMTDDFEFISLQKEIRLQDKESLRNSPVRHFGHFLVDFTDTAALCKHMDLVVCVDTSVAHLAGALAVPTWILLPFTPDWRWLLGREDSPWKRSVKL